MDTGDNGDRGLHAVFHVSKEVKQEQEFVLNLSTEEKNVLVMHLKRNIVL